jgi:hypothetical protein
MPLAKPARCGKATVSTMFDRLFEGGWTHFGVPHQAFMSDRNCTRTVREMMETVRLPNPALSGRGAKITSGWAMCHRRKAKDKHLQLDRQDSVPEDKRPLFSPHLRREQEANKRPLENHQPIEADAAFGQCRFREVLIREGALTGPPVTAHNRQVPFGQLLCSRLSVEIRPKGQMNTYAQTTMK